MNFTEEDIRFNWDLWGETKPWYCKECDSLLASDAYLHCDGTDPEIEKHLWHPHTKVFASPPVSFEEYKEIFLKQNKA